MTDFVSAISRYAKTRRPGFFVLPQNGELLLEDGRYLAAIDGIGKEDLFYGETGDGIANPVPDVRHMIGILNRAKSSGRPVFVIEYLADPNVQRSVLGELHQAGFVGTFAERSLSQPPALPPAALPVSIPPVSPPSLAPAKPAR